MATQHTQHSGLVSSASGIACCPIRSGQGRHWGLCSAGCQFSALSGQFSALSGQCSELALNGSVAIDQLRQTRARNCPVTDSTQATKSGLLIRLKLAGANALDGSAHFKSGEQITTALNLSLRFSMTLPSPKRELSPWPQKILAIFIETGEPAKAVDLNPVSDQPKKC